MLDKSLHDNNSGAALRFLKMAEGSTIKKEPFKPVGIGKPMTIKLVTIYAGDYRNGIFQGKRDMAVLSTMKTPNVSDVKPMAIHQIYDRMEERQALHPSAKIKGTPLIYCTPSFVDDGLMISLEFKIDNFDAKQATQIGNTLSTMGDIPLFSGASLYLKAGGEAIKLITPFIKNQLQKPAWLTFDFDLVIQEAGRSAIQEGYHLMYNTKDEEEFSEYEADNFGSEYPELINKDTKKPYKGGRPYGIISINGENKYRDFAPALASAAIMEKFYGIQDNPRYDEDIKGLLQVSNDYLFYRRIEQEEEALKNMEEGSDEYKASLERIKAYKKNLVHKIFESVKNS